MTGSYSPSSTGPAPDAPPVDDAQLAHDLTAVYDQDVLLTQLREMAQMEGRRRALHQERQVAASRLMVATGHRDATPEERAKAGAEAAQLTQQSEALLWEADDIRRRAGALVQAVSATPAAGTTQSPHHAPYSVEASLSGPVV